MIYMCITWLSYRFQNSHSSGSDTKHGYVINPAKQDYFFVVKAPKADAKISSGNVFKALANGKPVGGKGMWLWRFQWNEVHAKLSLRKPWLAVSSQLFLEKGKPVKFAWRTA